MSDPSLTNFPGKSFLMRIIAQAAIRKNWQKKVSIINKARGLHYRNNFKTTLDAHRTSNVFFKENEIVDMIIHKPQNSQTQPSSIIFPAPSWAQSNTVDDAMRDDIENYMPGDILVKTDRASMANSLELRSPFLDVPFAEFAISLPHQLKITKDEDKAILRRAYESLWPETIRTRSKQGFGAPVEIWMNKPEMRELINTYLNDPKKKIFNYISFEKTRRYVAEKKYKLWILLNLSIWMETHEFN
jgi:asparagine synthase (glutamine-hydrolysing)